MFNYSELPQHIRRGVRCYIEEGVEPGSFLQALIKNDLANTVCLADNTNLERLKDIVMFFIWEVPGECWGSGEKYERWIRKGGINGIKDQALSSVNNKKFVMNLDI